MKLKLLLLLGLVAIVLVSGCCSGNQVAPTEEEESLVLSNEELSGFGFNFSQGPIVSKENLFGAEKFSVTYDLEDYQYILYGIQYTESNERAREVVDFIVGTALQLREEDEIEDNLVGEYSKTLITEVGNNIDYTSVFVYKKKAITISTTRQKPFDKETHIAIVNLLINKIEQSNI
jgi:hypothetical protein